MIDPPAPEDFPCPGCGRRIIRPQGSTTTCVCKRQIEKLTPEELIVMMMLKTNDILGEMEHG